MAEEKRFTIERVDNRTYLDDTQRVVDGFTIRVRLHQWDEVREIIVANDRPETIEQAVNQALERRELLDELG